MTGYDLPTVAYKRAIGWIVQADPIFVHRGWVAGREGKVYLRYGRGFDRLDLAAIEIGSDFQRRGVTKELLGLLGTLPVKTIKVETVQVAAWAEKLAVMLLPGRSTQVTESIRNTVWDICYVRPG